MRHLNSAEDQKAPSISRARRAIVRGHLLNKRQELTIEGDDHTLLAELARGRAHVEIKVDRAHDPVATHLIDQRLDRQPIMGDRLRSTRRRAIVSGDWALDAVGRRTLCEPWLIAS